ncbi:hypothetical protein [Bradyrhizobium sp. ORS 111]|uniref:hypothetical protein n=1 Tax=Bradyrhizobium sp. ORS 111 TaxID=1685958 RepID=UPI00388D13D0
MYRKSIKLAAVGGIVLTLASSAAFAEGTAAQRQACTPDVFGCAAISSRMSARSSLVCEAMKPG